MIKQDIYLQPGEKISSNLLDSLKEVGENFTKNKNRNQYLIDLKEIFKIQTNKLTITTDLKLWLGGFVEGEGSLNVSCKKLKTAKFGLFIDPEFSITQHVNGFSSLFLALEVLHAGRIYHKSDSNATLVLRIDNRQTLEEKVLPFYENYVVLYGSTEKISRLKRFKQLLELFNQDAHLNQDSFINQILPLWFSLRKQVGQSNESCPTLEAAQQYVIDHIKKKTKS
jgi:hypothetical protein